MVQAISVFDMLKIGIGPSSSHTLGPWQAARLFVQQLRDKNVLQKTTLVRVQLYGSLALTGKGHGTDIALVLGLYDADPVSIPVEQVQDLPQHIKKTKELLLGGTQTISFDWARDIEFLNDQRLPFHANGMQFSAFDTAGILLHSVTSYSTGGGFVVEQGDDQLTSNKAIPPYPFESADELAQHCEKAHLHIHELIYTNEQVWRDTATIEQGLQDIWAVMLECMYRSCHTEGILPGGLEVKRRAAGIHTSLIPHSDYKDAVSWVEVIRSGTYNFTQILDWVSCFALAVNEENANFGRVVTAPTNGAAGVIPAVLLYNLCFLKQEFEFSDIRDFLLVASAIGSLFKENATISAAMGGCQAEIGVSSAMAAGALTVSMGGSVSQALEAAEIAMEHHLGLTCDPVGGLVQIPCIERNSMGAVKAITAAGIALKTDATKAKVSLDTIIKTMWETAQDMNLKYKETSLGGLAVNISTKVVEC